MKNLLLVGGGHAQLFVLQALARKPRADINITLISPSRWQHYSGMLPGWMAGRYRIDECRIDLRALAQGAGATLIEGAIIGMDADTRCVSLSDGRQIHYDLLSVDTGSETDTSELAELGERLLPIKPLQRFAKSWADILKQARTQADYRLVVMGGGAGGVELALAAAHALLPINRGAQTCLVAGEAGPLPDFGETARRHIANALQRAGVQVIAQRGVGAGAASGVMLKDGSLLAADHVIAATGARAPAWLQQSRLQLDPAGFITVTAQHRSLSHPEVFAAGDVCARIDLRLARSGVQAVRAGPVVAHNVLATLNGEPRPAALRAYIPRRHSLYLLSTGDGRAVASWGALSTEGRWVWHLKDWIDRRFIQRFS